MRVARCTPSTVSGCASAAACSEQSSSHAPPATPLAWLRRRWAARRAGAPPRHPRHNRQKPRNAPRSLPRPIEQLMIDLQPTLFGSPARSIHRHYARRRSISFRDVLCGCADPLAPQTTPLDVATVPPSVHHPQWAVLPIAADGIEVFNPRLTGRHNRDDGGEARRGWGLRVRAAATWLGWVPPLRSGSCRQVGARQS
jgi:hypothetical protein